MELNQLVLCEGGEEKEGSVQREKKRKRKRLPSEKSTKGSLSSGSPSGQVRWQLA